MTVVAADLMKTGGRYLSPATPPNLLFMNNQMERFVKKGYCGVRP
jgi:hypothetical protein